MKNIIACIDGSSMSTSVCDASIWAAKHLDIPLKILHVLDKSEYPVTSELSGSIGLGSREQLLEDLTALDEQRSKLALKHGKYLLADMMERANQQGLPNVIKQQRHGDFVESLLDIEAETRLLVIGKSGEAHQNQTTAIGSQLESVIRSIKAHTLVAIKPFNEPTSFMIAFDGSDISLKLIDKAIKTPLLNGLTCHLVMVKDENDRTESFHVAAKKLRAANIDVLEKIIEGDIHSALVHYQTHNDIGLIVMGAYGHSRVRQFFLGSNTTEMLTKSQVPLLLIR
ncbi:universal stress protein [Photobacterium indicum]|uniref:Universal stress protein UspA n=1 Tax=Photobacterium indicum TaxID=81447 RepID=A0A2T3L4J7_9GAMM|nr:universal stress protein [Photobacterium indicum]PSV44431.1 universal stress protein UspA [Photobacterium indicum]